MINDDEFNSIFGIEDSGKEDEALASLQEEIERLKNDRDEEKFLLFVVLYHWNAE